MFSLCTLQPRMVASGKKRKNTVEENKK